jgi:nicotinamide mononucleotide transporter
VELISEYTVVIEIIGAVLSLIYLFFSIRKSLWLWPVGLLASGFYILVFYFSKLYAEMGLQVYYIGVSVYGWYYWMFGNKQTVGPKEVPVSRVNSKGILNYSGIFLALFITIYIILLYFTDSTIPGWDALATALSLVATWMLAKKILENWIVWIVADALCIGISLYKDLYFTSALFVVYTIMAYVGYQNWKKSMQ